MQDPDTELFVRSFMTKLFRERGVAGVCRILGSRMCRSIRNRYLLKLNSDDMLALLLLVLVGTLLMRTFKN